MEIIKEINKKLPKMHEITSKVIKLLKKEGLGKNRAEFYLIVAILLKKTDYKEKVDFDFIETLYNSLLLIPKHPIEQITREQAKRMTKKINEEINEEAKNGSN